jgi:hypothetical protein
MKKLFDRLPSSRSFTRFLSILTFAVVAFAALELLAAQQALAGIKCCKSQSCTAGTAGCTCVNGICTKANTTDCICDSSLSCNITRISRVTGLNTLYNKQFSGSCWNLNSYGSIGNITSKIDCENVNGTGTTFLDSTSFTQSALLFCEVTESLHNDTGFCQYDLSYSQTGLRTCVNNNDGNSTATWEGLCSEVSGGSPGSQLQVTGTLKCDATLQTLGATIQPPPNPINFDCATSPGGCDCATSPGGCGLPAFCGNPDCILNLGIEDEQGKCSDLFPAGSGLLAGQVLGFSQTVEGPGCGPESEILAFGLTDTVRYCSGGTFDNAAVDCTPQNQEPFTGLGLAQTSVQFDVTFSPTSLNINCGTNNNDTWHFKISANQHLTDLTRIVESSLAVEGVSGQVTCDPVNTTVVPNTRTCHINACQQNPQLVDLATVVCNNNPKGRADLTVTGTLDTGIAIFGEDLNRNTTGQCQPLQ